MNKEQINQLLTEFPIGMALFSLKKMLLSTAH